MQVIEDQVIKFSKDNAPCYTAQPGEVLLFKTQDCFAGRIPSEDVTMKDLNFSYGFTNPAAGPVYVEGAEPGDVLVVDIYDIVVADQGVIATDDHCGPLFETTDYRSKIIPIEGLQLKKKAKNKKNVNNVHVVQNKKNVTLNFQKLKLDSQWLTCLAISNCNIFKAYLLVSFFYL